MILTVVVTSMSARCGLVGVSVFSCSGTGTRKEKFEEVRRGGRIESREGIPT